MVVGKDGRQLRNDGIDIEMRTIYGDGLVDGLVADVELLDGSGQRRQHIGKAIVTGIECSQCRKRSSQDTQISLESVMRYVEAFQFRENKSGGRKIARQLLIAQVECFYVSFFQGHALQLGSTLFALAHIPGFLPSHLDEGGIEHGEEFPLLSIHLVDGELIVFGTDGIWKNALNQKVGLSGVHVILIVRHHILFLRQGR